MKKIIVCILILMMVVPVQAFAYFAPTELPDKANKDFNGMFEIAVKTGDTWINHGNLEYGKIQETKEIDLGEFLKGDTALIRITQNGGGSAYLDAVFLDGTKAVKANGSDGKVLNKLSKEDLDITPVEDGIILEFEASGGKGVLSVTGRIENEIISQEPLQFPLANNYKIKNQITDFYSYKLNSNYGKITVDGELDEVINLEVFAQEYQVPGSGHPAGVTYFWVMNDYENLYVTMDFTPDNTYDGDKDYGKVYVNTSDGIKEFKVSVPEKNWGNAGFTYTNMVVYEHKVYEFSIPLSEINAVNGEEISISFVVYGTASIDPIEIECRNPDIAYDTDKELYLSVFEYDIVDEQGSAIYGEVLDNNGNVIIDQFEIEGDREKKLYSPTVAYDKKNKNFLVIWSEPGSSNRINLLRARTVKMEKNIDNSYYTDIKGPFNKVSGNDESKLEKYSDFIEQNPELEYGDDGELLLVWDQYYFKEGDSKDIVGSDIYGRIINSANTLQNNNFLIDEGIDSSYDDFSVSYDPTTDAFLVARTSYNGDQKRYNIDVQVVKSADAIENGDINIASTSYYALPSVSFNISNSQFLITWEDEDLIRGQYIKLNSNLLPEKVGDYFIVSPDLPDDEYFNCNPTSYNDGRGNMLCVWDTNYTGLDKYYARLQYIDNEGNYIGDAFFTDKDEYKRDNLNNDRQIAISGDNKGKVIIAYNYMPEQAFQRSSDNNNNNKKFSEDISYRIFGKYEIEPYIEFDKEIYNIDLGVDETSQTQVSLYNSEYPGGTDVTKNEYLAYIIEDEGIATISEDGLITGLSAGTTTVSAIYYQPQAYALSEGEVTGLPEGALLATATISVIAPEPGEPSLTFVPNTIEKYVGDEFSVKINYFNGLNTTDVTSIVEISIDDTNVAVTDSAIKGKIICKSVGETTLRTTHAGITATAIIKVKKSVVPSGSSTPVRTPIGQILVDNKIVETIYKEDVKVKNNTYTFTTTKSGETAKLWLDSAFYKDLAKDYPNRVIKFNWDRGTYTLPLNCSEVLKQIDSSAKKVNILIEKVDDDKIIKEAERSAEDMGAEIISDLIDFSVFVEKIKGNINIKSLDFYAERTIDQLDEINKNISTAMKFVEDKETLTFAPSVFDDDTATIKYRGNGIFAIVNNPKTFSDISNHWSKMNVERLAARNIAFGKDGGLFAPNDYITRAEFAVMITRALGITEEEGTTNFEDIKDWYEEDIATAHRAGLINGKGDGKFYPNERILRKDMTVMIHNALKFAGNDEATKNIEGNLSMFVDSSAIDEYARESVAKCAETGIILGRDTKEFDPNENATRAEASAIIERMLRYLEFIN